MGVQNVWTPNLRRIELHPFFTRSRWNTDDDTYAPLEQSFIFATLLLQSANPYFASFLPHTIQAVEGQHTIVRLNDVTAVQDPIVSNLLKEVAVATQWRVEPGLWQKHRVTSGISCISRPQPPDQLEFDETQEEVTASDQQERAQGRTRRQLTITITNEFVGTLKYYKAGTQEHLTISFMAAITMLGEIARAAYLSDFDRSISIVPYIGTDRINSFHHSFIAWLFGGWYPEPMNMAVHNLPDAGLCWVRQTTIDAPRPYYITKYSMDVDYLGRVMSQEAWDGLSVSDQQNHGIVADRLLRPQLPFRRGHSARMATDDYRSSHGVNQWKSQQRGHGDHQVPQEIPPYHDPDWDAAVKPPVNITVWLASLSEGLELDGTSTGRVKNAKPPRDWIREELVATQALGLPCFTLLMHRQHLC